MSAATISLGEALRRVSGSIYNDLQVQLQMFPGLSPESRYLRLKFFVLKSKKKLYQLLAVFKWASAAPSSTRAFFDNLRAVQARIEETEGALDEGQDHMYFLHRDLYWSRLKSADVAVGADIMARGSYPYYPEGMFTCGRLPRPRATDDESALLRDLHLYIRAKVCLHDPIPFDVDFSEVRGGCLLLRRKGLFDLRLSLVDLSERSAWRVTGFEVLVGYSPHEGMERELAPSAAASFRAGTLGALRRCAATLNASTAPSSSSSGALPDLLSRCKHASQALALRYLYLSARELTRAEWQGYADASFSESAEEAVFAFAFWRSQSSSHFTLEARWVQRRGSGVLGAPLLLQLWTRRPLGDASDGSAASFEYQEVEGLSSRLHAEKYVREGVSFDAFLADLLSLCSAHRAGALHRRLLASAARGGLEVVRERATASCSLRLGRAVITVHPDSRKGLYTLLLPGGGGLGLAPFAPFAAELNGVEGEEVSRAALVREGIAGITAALRGVETLELVCRQLYVMHWSALLEGILGVAGELAAAPSTALLLARAGQPLDGRSSIYKLRGWKSVAVHKKKLAHLFAVAFPHSLQRGLAGVAPYYPPPGADAAGESDSAPAKEVVFSSEGIVRNGSRRRAEDGEPVTKKPRRSVSSGLATAAHPLLDQLRDGESGIYLIATFAKDSRSATLSSMVCLNDYLQSVDIGSAPEPRFDFKALGELQLDSSLDSISSSSLDSSGSSRPYRLLSREVAAAARNAADLRIGYPLCSSVDHPLPPQRLLGGCDNILLCRSPADGCAVMLRTVGAAVSCQFLLIPVPALQRALGGSKSGGSLGVSDEQCQQLLQACAGLVHECELVATSESVAVNAEGVSRSAGERGLVIAQYMSNSLLPLSSSAACEELWGLLLGARAAVLFCHAVYAAAAMAEAGTVFTFTHSQPSAVGPPTFTFAARPSLNAKISAFLSVTAGAQCDALRCKSGKEVQDLLVGQISAVCVDIAAGRSDSYRSMVEPLLS